MTFTLRLALVLFLVVMFAYNVADSVIREVKP